MLRPEAFIYESDPRKQTIEWANKVISRRRMDWRAVIDVNYYRKMKSILLSLQDLTPSVKKYFTDEEYLRNTVFRPLPIMEKTKNIIIDQAREAGIKPYIEAVDPSATIDKKQDIFRLQHAESHVGEVTKMRKNVGIQTPYALREKDFNGNVRDFTKMGLNPMDESEVKFFFDTHYKLKYEIAAQTAVLSYLAANKAEIDIPRYCIDIMSVKTLCKQDYVSRLTGQIITKYLQPTQVYWIPGNARDGFDSSVKGWERLITIQELMSALGDKFDFERDWRQLIMAINYASGSNNPFTGFVKGGNAYNLFEATGNLTESATENASEVRVNLLNYDDCFNSTYNYMVYFGFIEWPQYCLHVEKRNTNTGQMFQVPNDYVPPPKSPWVREEKGYFKTKQSYYLAWGAYSQQPYNYGDMYMMPTMGDSDEFCAGSISIIREEGLSGVAAVENYIELANYAYYKMLWAIHRSKPDQWDYSFESIRDVAQKLGQPLNKQGSLAPQTPGTFQSAVDQLIEKFEKKLFKIHTNPNIDGQPIGGGGSGHIKVPGALDALAVQLRELVLEWAEQQVADKFGLAGLANAQAPNPRDGLKLNELYLRQSRQATGYIPRMIDQGFRSTADIMLMYIQDILKFPQTIAYKYLVRLVGQECVDDLATITDASPRRYAITATSYSNWPDKKDQMLEALAAFQKGLITFSEYQLLKLIDDPRVAAKQSAFFQEKGERRKEAQTKAANEFTMALEDKKAANLFKIEKYKADSKTLQERIRTNGYIYQADKMAESKKEAANIAAGATVNKEESKVEAKKEELQDKATIQLQQSLLSGNG